MRVKHGLFVIEGEKSVRDLILEYSVHFQVEYIVALSSWLERHSELHEEKLPENIVVYECSSEDMRICSSFSTPPEVLAVCRLPEFPSPEAGGAGLPPDLYLLLDGIQDPGNLGTIIRTSHWFGIKKIFASIDTADLFNPKTIQSSMASLSAVEVVYTDLRELIDLNPDFPVIGLMLEGENIFTTSLPSRGFIVMGNEGNGLSEAIIKRLSMPLTIPPYDKTDHAESLNVGVATGITLSQFRK